MSKAGKFSLTARLNSFLYAFNGLKILFKTEHNAWIHTVSAIVAISMGFLFNLSIFEWCYIVIAIGIVFVAEIINTSIEYLTDFISPGMDERAKKVKDLAAAAVFVSSLTSLAIGVLIFLPKIICFLLN